MNLAPISEKMFSKKRLRHRARGEGGGGSGGAKKVWNNLHSAGFITKLFSDTHKEEMWNRRNTK